MIIKYFTYMLIYLYACMFHIIYCNFSIIFSPCKYKEIRPFNGAISSPRDFALHCKITIELIVQTDVLSSNVMNNRASVYLL